MEPRGMRTARAKGKSGAVVAAAGRWEVPADPGKMAEQDAEEREGKGDDKGSPGKPGYGRQGSGEAKCKATGWADRKMIENLRAVRMFPGTQLTGKFRKTMARRANGKQRATPLR